MGCTKDEDLDIGKATIIQRVENADSTHHPAQSNSATKPSDLGGTGEKPGKRVKASNVGSDFVLCSCTNTPHRGFSPLDNHRVNGVSPTQREHHKHVLSRAYLPAGRVAASPLAAISSALALLEAGAVRSSLHSPADPPA